MALSTSEAEYVTMANTKKNLMVCKQIFVESRLMHNGYCALKCENQAACAMPDKAHGTKRRKYIDFWHQILQHLIRHNILRVHHVVATAQNADMFTNSLRKQTFSREF